MMAHPVAGIAVSIVAAAYAPGHVDVLQGDMVTWSNDSVRRHTVTAVDQAWTSPSLFGGDRFAREFGALGAIAYYCEVHPSMRGEVDVHALLLDAPREPGAPGRPYTVAGRAALPAGTAVTIEGDDGSGAFHPVARATVADDGAFHASVVPHATGSYRAVSADQGSPAVRLLVLDRHVTATSARQGRRTIVRVLVDPASPRATVVIQLRLRERFGWWPSRRARLDHHSRATFSLRLHRSVRARAVLTLADGATPLARSGELRIGARSRPRR